MNNSGNVGKSVICDALFFPRIPNVEKINIETICYHATSGKTVTAKDVKTVFKLMDTKDIAIIDVGSSNIEKFMSNLTKVNGSHQDIDFFFIPTIPKDKQQRNTLSTIESLLDLGVAPEKIKLIFNMHDPDYAINKLYSIIFNSEIYKTLKLKDKTNIFTITDNPVFDMLFEMGINFSEIANDTRDFKALIRATKDKKERARLSYKLTALRLAQAFAKELDVTFKRINASCNLIPN